VKSIKIKAFAKVNLGLRILEKRDDGYHNIESILQTISLFDELNISLAAESIVVTANNPELPLDETNLCYKAADILLKRTGQKRGVIINIKKNIPIGAGLGGGSSDAASVLTGLNLLLSLSLNKEELRKIAVSIGSDVPFFIDGGTAFVSGRGEKIEPINKKIRFNYLIVFPGFSIDTKWAYEKINFLTKRENYITIFNCYFNDSNSGNLELLLKNDFEEVMLGEYVELKKVRRFLIQNGAVSVSLSGSGSSIFGIFDDIMKMNNALSFFAGKGYWAKEAFSIRSSEIPQFALE